MLLLAVNCSLIDWDAGLEGLNVLVEASYVLWIWSYLYASVACEDYILEVVGKVEVVRVVDAVVSQEGNTPGTAFTCSLHHRDRRVESSSEDLLTYDWSLEQTAMTGDAIHLYVLLLEEHVVAELEHSHGAEEVGTHQVSEVEAVVG